MPHVWRIIMNLSFFAKALPILGCALCLAGCAADDPGGEQTQDPVADAGACLQLSITLEAGLELDGESIPSGQLGSSLHAALEDGSRTPIVDVKCAEGVTMASIRSLHDAMIEREIYRIQYLRDPEAPIPHLLPSPEMAAHLEDMAADHLCSVAIDARGGVLLAGKTIDRQALRADVGELLKSSPEIVIVVEAVDAVRYDDFVGILGELTEAGAQRIAIKLAAG
jgi:biopolymer transport protein ExbD